jgi:hypothetical protein
MYQDGVQWYWASEKGRELGPMADDHSLGWALKVQTKGERIKRCFAK